jgi:hypothetical protein
MTVAVQGRADNDLPSWDTQACIAESQGLARFDSFAKPCEQEVVRLVSLCAQDPPHCVGCGKQATRRVPETHRRHVSERAIFQALCMCLLRIRVTAHANAGHRYWASLAAALLTGSMSVLTCAAERVRCGFPEAGGKAGHHSIGLVIPAVAR